MIKRNNYNRIELRVQGIHFVNSIEDILTSDQYTEAMYTATRLLPGDEELSMIKVIFGKNAEEIDKLIKLKEIKVKVYRSNIPTYIQDLYINNKMYLQVEWEQFLKDFTTIK